MNNTLKNAFTIIIAAGLVFIAFGSGITHCTFYDNKNSSRSNVTAWCSISWIQTTQADFNAGVPFHVDTTTYPGDVILSRIRPFSAIYAFTGNNQPYFLRYYTSNNTWVTRANGLFNVGEGGALAYDGDKYVYAISGVGTRNFMRYDVLNDTWVTRANTLQDIWAGGSLACAGNYIYAFAGGGLKNFMRYDISGNTWVARTDALGNVRGGAALAYDGGNYIYALQGNGQNSFWRYNISADSWAALLNTPQRVNDGGALVYDGGNYIYVLRGSNQDAFWRYTISSNTWTSMANTPTTLKEGGALAYDGTYVYAFKGKTTPTFWSYTISNNTWTSAANALYNVFYGGSLAYVPRSNYFSTGTLASQVLDTTTNGTHWDVHVWNATLPGSTAITFEVRASNTSFAKNAASPSWTAVGGTSPISSGLPAGRYMQWRATLTTSNTTVTPVLQDVTVYYTDP